MGRRKIEDERKRKVTQTIRLSRYVSDWIDRQDESAGKLIEAALIKQYNIKALD